MIRSVQKKEQERKKDKETCGCWFFQLVHQSEMQRGYIQEQNCVHKEKREKK